MQPELRLHDPGPESEWERGEECCWQPAPTGVVLMNVGCALLVWFFALIGLLWTFCAVAGGCARLVG